MWVWVWVDERVVCGVGGWFCVWVCVHDARTLFSLPFFFGKEKERSFLSRGWILVVYYFLV